MRSALAWIRKHPGRTLFLVVLVLFVYWVCWPRDVWPRGHAKVDLYQTLREVSGTVEHPSSMRNSDGSALVEDLPHDTRWRVTHVKDVLEALPADGYEDGRCLVALGKIYGGDYYEFDGDAPPLTITYAANGVTLETGDAARACNADAIAQAVIDVYGGSRGDMFPLDEVAMASSEHTQRDRSFFHVTYLVGNVEPDVVVVAAVVPVEGEPVPAQDSNVIAFQLSNPNAYGTWIEAWNEIFGLSHQSSDAEEGAE